jgi:hypothetical protein
MALFFVCPFYPSPAPKQTPPSARSGLSDVNASSCKPPARWDVRRGIASGRAFRPSAICGHRRQRYWAVGCVGARRLYKPWLPQVTAVGNIAYTRLVVGLGRCPQRGNQQDSEPSGPPYGVVCDGRIHSLGTWPLSTYAGKTRLTVLFPMSRSAPGSARSPPRPPR